MVKETNLYGDRDPFNTKTKHRPINSSTTASFSSSLSALISSGKTKPADKAVIPNGNSLKRKSDIFSSHNRNVKARAASDMEQVHKTKSDFDSVSAAEYHRSKRKMEDKARLYNQMKRGEFIGREDYDNGLIDFDRKAAEKGDQSNSSEEGESDEDEPSSAVADLQAEWIDEFGRLRKGTKKEKAHYERQQRIQTLAKNALDEDFARPQAPANVIYGDTVQRDAFNPDRNIAQKMADLAAKRDKSATPPPETHYNASAEIRNRGTGFYAFSGDAEMRKEEMESLEREREETEKVRKGREEAKDKRKEEIEERRRAIEAKRKQRRDKDAEDFLNSLDIPAPTD
jgi:hypothetical protein